MVYLLIQIKLIVPSRLFLESFPNNQWGLGKIVQLSYFYQPNYSLNRERVLQHANGPSPEKKLANGPDLGHNQTKLITFTSKTQSIPPHSFSLQNQSTPNCRVFNSNQTNPRHKTMVSNKFQIVTVKWFKIRLVACTPFLSFSNY